MTYIVLLAIVNFINVQAALQNAMIFRSGVSSKINVSGLGLDAARPCWVWTWFFFYNVFYLNIALIQLVALLDLPLTSEKEKKKNENSAGYFNNCSSKNDVKMLGGKNT